MIEVRKLTREEFNDLVANAEGELKSLKVLESRGIDTYTFYQKGGEAIVINGVPVYCGCVETSTHFSYTILRKTAREKYPITLFKIVKRYLRSFKEVKCVVPESRLLYRWIERLGFKRSDDIFILRGA